jgi:hypothetical protein
VAGLIQLDLATRLFDAWMRNLPVVNHISFLLRTCVQARAVIAGQLNRIGVRNGSNHRISDRGVDLAQ